MLSCRSPRHANQSTLSLHSFMQICCFSLSTSTLISKVSRILECSNDRYDLSRSATLTTIKIIVQCMTKQTESKQEHAEKTLFRSIPCRRREPLLKAFKLESRRQPVGSGFRRCFLLLPPFLNQIPQCSPNELHCQCYHGLQENRCQWYHHVKETLSHFHSDRARMTTRSDCTSASLTMQKASFPKIGIVDY